jgi:hypothetical protein
MLARLGLSRKLMDLLSTVVLINNSLPLGQKLTKSIITYISRKT